MRIPWRPHSHPRGQGEDRRAVGLTDHVDQTAEGLAPAYGPSPPNTLMALYRVCFPAFDIGYLT
jgi:hypothetical protein